MATCQKPKETKQTGGIFIILARAEEKKMGTNVYIFLFSSSSSIFSFK
jgi:hypothetical protein